MAIELLFKFLHDVQSQNGAGIEDQLETDQEMGSNDAD